MANGEICFEGIWSQNDSYGEKDSGTHKNGERLYNQDIVIYVSNTWNHAMDTMDTNSDKKKYLIFADWNEEEDTNNNRTADPNAGSCIWPYSSDPLAASFPDRSLNCCSSQIGFGTVNSNNSIESNAGLCEISDEDDFFPDSPLSRLGLNKDFYEVPSIPTTQEEIETVLREALDKFRGFDFDKVVVQLDEAVDNISSTLRGVDNLVNSPEMQSMFSSISSNMNAMEKLITDLDRQLDPLLEDKLDVLLSDLSDSSKALTRALEQGEKVFAQMEATAVDERYALSSALTEISKSSRAIRLLVDHLQREPRSLIYGKK